MLVSRSFRRSFEQALDEVRTELVELGVTSPAQLRRAVVDAYRLLGKSKVTANDWVGRVFEIIAPDLPEVALLERVAVRELRGLVNRFVGRGRPGAYFVDGYGNGVRVTKPFTKVQAIVAVKIRRPNNRGVDYVDRGYVISNADGQHLFVSCEYKARGARGKLREQTTQRDPRLIDKEHPSGTELTFLTSSGRAGTPIDLKDLIIVSGPRSPEFLRQSGVFSRIAVGAGSRFRAGLAKDQNGEPYIRIIAPVATDPLRRLLEKLLQDRSWQR